MTTWASAMSAVPLAASSLPTLVASTRSRSAMSVVSWRMSRDSRACRSGLRMAWASADAGTVTWAPDLPRAGDQEPDDAVVVPVQGDQGAGVQGHARHQAACRCRCRCRARHRPRRARRRLACRRSGAAPRRASRPSRDIVQGDGDGMLHEPGYARRGPRLHEGADLVELGLVERDGDLPCRHTGYHTTRSGARCPRPRARAARPSSDLSVAAGHPPRDRRLGETVPSGDGSSQARVSQIEHGRITELDAVHACIEALGGTVDVLARAGDWTVKVA